MKYLIVQDSRSLSKSAVAFNSSVTCGVGPDGGHAERKHRSLLNNSVLYTVPVMFARSIELKMRKQVIG